MDPGKLRHRIKIQSPTPTQDGFGQPIQAWGDLVTDFPARRIDQAGDESEQGSQVSAIKTRIYECYWLASVTEECRIIDGSNTWYVVRIEDLDGREFEMRLTCRDQR